MRDGIKHCLSNIERMLHIGMECPERTIVDTKHIGDTCLEIFQLRGVVHFEQDFQMELMGEFEQSRIFLRSKSCGNEQDGICPQHLGFIDLIGIDDELLTEYRTSTDEPTHTGDIFRLASEIFFVGKY